MSSISRRLLGEDILCEKQRIFGSGPPFRCRRSVLRDKRRKRKKLSSLCSYFLSIIHRFIYVARGRGRRGQAASSPHCWGRRRRVPFHAAEWRSDCGDMWPSELCLRRSRQSMQGQSLSLILINLGIRCYNTIIEKFGN
jgi:hypothetical protein